MKNKRLVIILVLTITAAVVFGLTFLNGGESDQLVADDSTFPVKRDDLVVIVTEGGSIQAQNTIEIKNEVDERQMTILDIVPEGTFITDEDVNNGKVLVELESSALNDELSQDQMNYDSAEAKYLQSKESYNIKKNQNESKISQAQLNVKFALMDLEKYIGKENAAKIIEDANNGVILSDMYLDALIGDPNSLKDCGAGQELQKLQDNIDISRDQLLQAQNQLNGTLKLHKAQYVSDLDLERDQLSVKTKQIQKESNELALELFKRYDFPKQIEKLLSDYVEATRELERTYAEARSTMAQAQADLKSAESNFRSRKERLEQTKLDLENCTIEAPGPGLVVYGSASDDYRRMRGQGIIAPGETVYRYQTLIRLPDLSKMKVDALVHESSIDKVKPGQRAKIVMDAFPDITLNGEVVKVASLPSQDRSWFSPDLKVYPTQINIEGNHGFLKPGMSAKVEILVNHIKDALIVPNHVVSNRLGKKVCYVQTPSGKEEREVKTGEYNDNFVQIVTGLKEGEKVLLSPPKMAQSQASAPTNGFEAEIQEDSVEQTWQEPSTSETGESETEQDQTRSDPARMELTDQRIERIMDMMSQLNPQKAQELKNLRESDPEQFKTELKKVIAEQMQQFRQRRGSDAQDNSQGEGSGRRGRSNRMGGQRTNDAAQPGTN